MNHTKWNNVFKVLSFLIIILIALMIYFQKYPVNLTFNVTKKEVVRVKKVEMDTTVVSALCDTVYIPVNTSITEDVEWMLTSIHNEPMEWHWDKSKSIWSYAKRSDFYLTAELDYECVACMDYKSTFNGVTDYYSIKYNWVTFDLSYDKVVNRLSLKDSRKIQKAFRNRFDYITLQKIKN